MGRGGQLLLPSLLPTFLTFKLLSGQTPLVEPVRNVPGTPSPTASVTVPSTHFKVLI